ncbi:MAG: LytTR family transcriptional regulator [Bacteroidetes bacterium]|nr:LytTR family transcriptional regulator [Bacteroidota bacterium]
MRTNTLTNLIVVPDSNNKKHPIDVRVVVKVKYEEGSVFVHFYNGRVMKFERPLNVFNELIVRHDFVRVNKDCLINPQYLEGLKPGRKVLAVLSDGSEESVGRDVRKLLAHYILDTVYS